MKHLRSSSRDLRRLFERAITIREIAEPLASFDCERPSEAVKNFMEANNFDVVGVRKNGRVVGFAAKATGAWRAQLGEVMIPFSPEEVFGENEPLSTAIQTVKNRPQLFVSMLGQVGGIVTKGDFQKTPVRLWLFGIISLIEMQMLRLIRQRFAEGTWMTLLQPPRVALIQKLFEELRRRNQESALSDCLQICDKAAIFLKEPQLAALAGFPSKRAGEEFFRRFEELRNDLAHSNDILKDRWPELADQITRADALLSALETASVTS